MLFLHRIFNGVWFMDRSFAENYLPLVAAYLNHSPVVENVGMQSRSGALALHTFARDKAETLVYTVDGKNSAFRFIQGAPENSVILLTISDAITKYDQECGPYGMLTYSNLIKEAYKSENIKGVALKIDSGGGEGTGMRLLSETISERNKPVIAFIDDFAASAAYGIASACDYVTANCTTARIGSIGCYLTIADYTEYFKKQGIDVKEIYAPQSKDKNKEYYDAVKGDTKALEQVAAVYCEDFICSVEKNRAGCLTAGREVWGTGKVFFAEEALKLGLIDNIDTFDNFLNYFNT